ncbi:Clp protease ClpP, partial [Bacillus thuringiensis]|nr:Clp protease ClpP [Bacillus thuringiensis]
TYMTAEKAKSFGFCDVITDSIQSSVVSESVITNEIDEQPIVVSIENEGDKRIQNAEKSANFMASLLQSIKL